MGDFNINLINVDKHIGTHDFLDIIYENTLFPAITKPTRVTINSATLIDNIFIPIENEETLQGILYTDISDHFPVFVIDYSNECSSEPPLLYKRVFSDTNNTITKIFLRDPCLMVFFSCFVYEQQGKDGLQDEKR